MCTSNIQSLLMAPLKAHGKLFDKITPKPLRGLNVAGKLADSLGGSSAPTPTPGAPGLGGLNGLQIQPQQQSARDRSGIS